MKNKRQGRGLRQFIANMYGYRFFNALLLAAPVYALFIQEHGVSDMGLAMLFIILSLAIVAFNLPTVWINRKFGYKKTILLGRVLKIAAFAILFLVPNYVGFTLGFLLWGGEIAIAYVAVDGVLYDELSARKNAKIYSKILGRADVFGVVGGMLSAGGSLLLFWGYDVVLYLSILGIVISSVFVMRMNVRARSVRHDVPAKKRKIGFLKSLRTSFRVILKKQCIVYCLALVILFGNFVYLDDYFSVIGLEIGLRPEFVGLVALLMQISGIFGKLIAHKFEKVKDRFLYLIMVVVGLLFVLFSIFYHVWGLLILGVAFAFISILNLLLYVRFQNFLPGYHRPIALSLYGMLDNLQYVCVMLLFGFAGELGGWRYSILIMGMCCIILGLWAVLFVRDKCGVLANAQKN